MMKKGCGGFQPGLHSSSKESPPDRERRLQNANAFPHLEDFPSKKSAIQAENHVSLSSSGGPGIQALHDEERSWWIPAFFFLLLFWILQCRSGLPFSPMLGPPDLLAEMEDLASKEMGKGNLPQSDGGPSIEGKSSREGKGILFYGFVRFLRRKVLHFGERRLHIYYYIGNSFLSGPPVLQAASGPGGGLQDSRGAGGV